MKYMLMICVDESAIPDQDVVVDGCGGWTEEMERRGVIVSGVGLDPEGAPTTVRVRGDDVLITDGPFAETKDLIGGITVIECANLDEAIEVASAHPVAKYGSIDIRPALD